jgi:hypothetical protein
MTSQTAVVKHNGKKPSQTPKYKLVRKRVASLKPSPENDQIYDPRDTTKLAGTIAKNDCVPLVILLDNWIVAGHQRHLALIENGQVLVWCQVIPKRRNEYTDDEFLCLLKEYNEQRHKNAAELIREEIIDMDPEDAYQQLNSQKRWSLSAAERNGIHKLYLGGVKKRHEISEDKAEHVSLILEIVDEREKYWPLSIRSVHYALLNYDFVRGYYWPRKEDADYGTKRELRYQNDDGSYDATADLITRLRFNNTISWQAFDDPTRPFHQVRSYDDLNEFVREEIDMLFAGVPRNLLLTQPAHIECFVEKNSIYPLALKITKQYHIPTSSGRGFNSADPWNDLYERYLESGKKYLKLIVLGDHDPEGLRIPIVGGQTLRDEFGIGESNLSIYRAGVTREQIERYKLPAQNFAKESSVNLKWYLEQTGGDDTVWELEALKPEDMLNDLENVIKNVIDIELFKYELATYKKECAVLMAKKKAFLKILKSMED